MNARDRHGQTALMRTARRGHVGLARLLCEHSACDTWAIDHGPHR